MLRLDPERVLAFRLSGHHLSHRHRRGSLLQAAASGGIQDSPPGSAALALFARVQGLTPPAIDQALVVDRTLLQAWSLRGSPIVSTTPTRCRHLTRSSRPTTASCSSERRKRNPPSPAPGGRTNIPTETNRVVDLIDISQGCWGGRNLFLRGPIVTSFAAARPTSSGRASAWADVRL